MTNGVCFFIQIVYSSGGQDQVKLCHYIEQYEAVDFHLLSHTNPGLIGLH
jgi:hypothetical protein